MAPENKLNISNPAELAKIEEKISKSKAVQLFENNIVEEFEVGKFSVLSKIHKFLFIILRRIYTKQQLNTSCCFDIIYFRGSFGYRTNSKLSYGPFLGDGFSFV